MLKDISKIQAVIGEMQSFREKLKKHYTNTDPFTGTWEDCRTREHVENIQETMNDTIAKLDYYTKPTVVGTLREMNNGKFELIDQLGVPRKYFTCGESIELYMEHEGEYNWWVSRVEYRERDGQKGYHFYSKELGHPFLVEGMIARYRLY